MNYSKYPLVKILFPYVLGIISAYFGQFSANICRFCFLFPLLFFIISIVLLPLKRYKWRGLQFLILFLGFVFAGFFTTNFRLSSRLSQNQGYEMKENMDWVVRIVDFPMERGKSMKTKVEILQTASGMKMQGHVLLYVQKSKESLNLKYGDVLLVHTKMEHILPSKKPDAFDNQKYMRRKGIFYTAYVQSAGWQKIENRKPNVLKAFSRNVQCRMSNNFAESGMPGQEYDIIRAILLGDDDTMEPELKAAYAAAGVSHILCVSGMHVGIIFMIMDFLLKPLDLFRSTRLVKSISLLLVIWLYAHITGLSPSVTRSATMFTFVTMGSLLQRNTNVFHSLLSSLFILLVINPLLLFEVGFQLSYLAVFGIVLFQPIIAGIYEPKTKIVRYFWELLSVSIAAQLGTFPISVYYFGQFPNYFILSNLSVISLSFIVMISGVALLAVSWIPILTKWVSFVLTWEIRIMNRIIMSIESLPGSVTQNIDYSIIQVVFLYGCIICAFIAIQRHSRKIAWFSYLCFALFSGCFLIRKMNIVKQEEMTVYAIRKVSALDFCFHQQAVLFSDSIRSPENSNYQFSIKNHARRQHAVRQFVPIDTLQYDSPFLCKRGDFIQFQDKTVYLLKRKKRLFPLPEPMNIDILILQYNPVQTPEEVAKSLRFRSVMADETNTPFYMERWRTWCQKNGIDFQ